MKMLNYTFILLLVLLQGCNDTSSSQNHPPISLENSEKIAIYIPDEKLESQKQYAKTSNVKLSFSKISKLIKEDAQGDNIGTKWNVYDQTPEGASIDIVYDEQRESSVIEFHGQDLYNGFSLGFWAKDSWKDTTHHIIQWSMNYAEKYYVYLRVSTKNGYRYLYYTPRDYSYGVVNYDVPHYIHHGLGTNSIDGSWRTFTRNLEEDLKEFEPNNELVSVDGFFIRGSGRIDDIALLTEEENTTTPSYIDNSIYQQIVNDNNYSIIYKNTKRALIQSYNPNTCNYNISILDISNLNEIKELQNYTFESASHLKTIKVQEDDYIIIADDKSFSIHDYNSGVRTSLYETNSWVGNNIEYILLEKNYTIIQDGASLKKLDFSNKENLLSTILYYGDASSFVISSDKQSILAKDTNGNLLKRVMLDGSSLTVEEAIEEWAKPTIDMHKSILIDKPLISENQKRAIVHIHNSPGILSFFYVVLDTSNIQNIKSLGISICEECGSGITKEKIMKNNDYILFLRYTEILLYDFNSATLLGKVRSSSGYSITYHEITEDYVIFSYYNKNKKFKFDFTNRTTPTISSLK